MQDVWWILLHALFYRRLIILNSRRFNRNSSYNNGHFLCFHLPLSPAFQPLSLSFPKTGSECFKSCPHPSSPLGFHQQYCQMTPHFNAHHFLISRKYLILYFGYYWCNYVTCISSAVFTLWKHNISGDDLSPLSNISQSFLVQPTLFYFSSKVSIEVSHTCK